MIGLGSRILRENPLPPAKRSVRIPLDSIRSIETRFPSELIPGRVPKMGDKAPKDIKKKKKVAETKKAASVKPASTPKSDKK